MREDLASKIEHTLLRPEATRADIENLCREAERYGFYGVCVNGAWVELARYLLEETEVKIITVVGFPLGACDSDVKRFETEAAIDNGAHEIDMVMNIGWLRDGEEKKFVREIQDVVEAAQGAPVKVILETSLLTTQEKIRACELIRYTGAQFVKTSTGFGKSGATEQDVRLLREVVGPNFGVKAAGGIRTLEQAEALLKAGADRIGTSHGVEIMEQLRRKRR